MSCLDGCTDWQIKRNYNLKRKGCEFESKWGNTKGVRGRQGEAVIIQTWYPCIQFSKIKRQIEKNLCWSSLSSKYLRNRTWVWGGSHNWTASQQCPTWDASFFCSSHLCEDSPSVTSVVNIFISMALTRCNTLLSI